MNALPTLILALVTLQRLSELVIARRNTARLLAMGGVEAGAAHYPVMVILHATWLAGLWMLALSQPVSLPLLAIYGVAQLFRLWILTSLGSRWTTRIITIPNEMLVARGPYKFIRHPNYALVAVEIPLLPLVFGLWPFALLFGILNLAMLGWRISVEDQALASINQS